NNYADTIHLEQAITSLSISIGVEEDFENMLIMTGKDTFIVQEDLHETPINQEKFSRLLIFKNPIKLFVFQRGKSKSTVLLHLINSGTTPSIENNNKRLNQDCGKPNTIDQSFWREGLPAPNYTPLYAKANHLIVHHTAGSNTDMDYTNVVRQIYLFHTEVQNYSDIGYNYLIAQDGSIYEGREGAPEREEDVVGAHFCGKNTNTMGISLLGNYETAVPSSNMLDALEGLLAWKLAKENLNPLEYKPHPAGTANAEPLGVIAAHRDGCATLCPGKNVYARMDEIKRKSEAAKSNLNSGIAIPILVQNEREGAGNVKLEVQGEMDGSYIWFSSENLADSIPGARNATYTTIHLKETTSYYVALKNGKCIGPLLKVEAIIKENQFFSYPNPTEGLLTVTFLESSTPSKLLIFNSMGQQIDFINIKKGDNKIILDTTPFAKGVYLLFFKSGGISQTSKFIVK
ncbi:MAG: N-acetylmuramoyl-L-alanine amidase, partial [Bacteroidota bacterium]|nr:N-acetylmuramoyl-L-alanine amidase [Bacteroidota bacterium]